MVPPTVAATLKFVAGRSGNTVYVGGNASISPSNPLNINVDGGNATLEAPSGSLAGSIVNLTDGGSFSNGANPPTVLNNVTVNYGPGGGTFIVNGSGDAIDLSSTTINGFAGGNNGLNNIEFAGLPPTPAMHYTITNNAEGTQTIRVLGFHDTPMLTMVIAGQSLPAGTYVPGLRGPLTVGYAPGGGAVIRITDTAVVCFLPGTQIRTAKGEVAIEDIRVGDEVLAFVNERDEVRKVTWIGSGSVYARIGVPSDEAGYPVRILKDAISEGVPYKDLLVTSEHGFFFAGALTPIRMLVNGRSIFYDRSIPSYTYHHFECAEHSIVHADGMLAETYLDTGNRRNFGQQSNVVRFAVKDWARDAAAPLCVDRAVVEPVFRAIEARAISQHVSQKAEPPHLTGDADLHLVTQGGRIIRQARSVDGVAMFMIPSNVGSVRIVSRTSRPADTFGPFVDDRRPLGVLIGAITLSEGGGSREITEHLTAARLAGWHGREASPCRWTNGDAVLSLGERAPNALAVLGLEVLSAGPYVAENRSFEDAVLNG